MTYIIILIACKESTSLSPLRVLKLCALDIRGIKSHLEVQRYLKRRFLSIVTLPGNLYNSK